MKLDAQVDLISRPTFLP